MTAPEVVTFGETMISLRAESLIRLGSRFTSSMAGAESTVAVGLARLGHTVAWVGATGDDEPGTLVTRTLRAEGVEAHVRIDPTRPTGLMLLEHRLGHTSRVTYHRAGSAGGNLQWSDVSPHLLPGVRLVHVSGITPALGPSARDATSRALAAAREMGVVISLDINHRELLWPRTSAVQALLPMMENVDHLIASEDELTLFGGDTEEANMSSAFAEGLESLVAKRGSAGVTVVTAAGRCDIAARNAQVVDTIGAGDAFTAGYLSGVLEGHSPRSCGQRGVDVATFAVSTRGDWEGLPTRRELELLDVASGETIR